MSRDIVMRHLSAWAGGIMAGALVTTVASLVGSSAAAADVIWSGFYRVEGVKVKNPELGGDESNKNYILNHLVLTPRMIAADGLTIDARLDVLNSDDFGIASSGRVDSVAGDVIGLGPGDTTSQTPAGANPDTDVNSSNAFAETQRAGSIAVTSLYLSWAHEFGRLVVGRMPFEFGLGTAFNAGTGFFDHYITTKDLVGYRLIFGHLSLFPIIAKVNEGTLGDEDDVNDYILQAQYENPETELKIGVLYQRRYGTLFGNDAPTDGTIGDPDPANNARTDGFEQSLIGAFFSQKLGDFRIGIEADILSGDTGLTASGTAVDLNAFAVAADLEWRPADSKLSGLLKAGFVSGDDPDTPSTYEGFGLNRNYDVALLLFNHPLGQADILRTALIRETANVENQIDTEAVSNAIYFAPSLQYQWKEKFSYGGRVVYAMLNKDPISNGDADSGLGVELDLNFTYQPFERFTWITEGGVLFPGDAWTAGPQNLPNDMVYGLFTKAAIAF